jgi:hypothetical protein
VRALPFPWRCAALVVGILVVGYILVLGLVGAALQKELSQRDQTIYRLIAAELRNDVERQLADGIALPGLQPTRMLVRRSLPEQEILGIGVVAPDGMIAFDTDPWRIDTKAPAEWWPPKLGGKEWTVRSATEGLVGVALEGSEAGSAGYAVLRYDPRPEGMQVRALLLHLTRLGLTALCLVGLFVVGAIFLLHRVHRRNLSDLVMALEAFEAGPERALRPGIPANLPHEIRHLVALASATMASLQQAGRDLLRIGAGENDRVSGRES